MNRKVKKLMLQIFTVVFVLLLLVIAVNVYIVATNGSPVPTPTVERKARTIGQGKPLNYLILGDSTAVAQGGNYEQGYVVQTAERLAQGRTVTYANFAVSGATIGDVYENQLREGLETLTPDLVLVAAGANDVTHLSSLKSVEQHLENIIYVINQVNPRVKVIFTGSASMGDVRRFPPPTSWLAGWRTSQINSVVESVSNKHDNVVFARIAEKTGEAFAGNDDYFAADNFHPSNKGYQAWTTVLNEVIADTVK